jgi:peptidoglycan/xylan/chitin deacetylase (PgdA/CDA1 family)
MRALHDQGVRAVSLTELLQDSQHLPTHQKTIAITFDDGFENIYQHAIPVLATYGFTATVFLVSDYCGKTNGWPSQPEHIPRLPLLGWSQIREMSDLGIHFGAHTKTHPDLTRLSEVAARDEIIESKKVIEGHVQQCVDTFAYPYGAYDSTIRDLVRAHFDLACSAALGYVRPGSDPLALERLDMYYLRTEDFFHQLLSWRTDAYLRVRRALRDFRNAWHV